MAWIASGDLKRSFNGTSGFMATSSERDSEWSVTLAGARSATEDWGTLFGPRADSEWSVTPAAAVERSAWVTLSDPRAESVDAELVDAT